MSNSPNMGFARRVAAGATAPSDTEFEFLSCTVQKNSQHVQSDGIRGLRGRQGEGVVEGVYAVGGALVMEPRPLELDYWLLRAMGGGSNPNFTLAETLPTFVLDVDKGGDVYRYSGMKVNTFSLRSAMNRPLQLTMDLQGTTETPAITFPTLSNITLTQPYMHHQLVLTLNSVAYQADNLEFSINNALILDRFLNSQTRTAIPESDRIVTIAADFPYGDQADALYDMAVGGIGGSAVWTNGAVSLTLTFVRLQAPTSGPEITSRGGELFRRITFQARRTTTTQELVVTNDSTP